MDGCAKSVLVKRILVALGWAFLTGVFPLLLVHPSIGFFALTGFSALFTVVGVLVLWGLFAWLGEKLNWDKGS